MTSYLRPPAGVNQSSPSPTYVYVHADTQGTPFFVGVGRRRDAWEAERHYFWTRYVDGHLKGTYLVNVVAEGLPDPEAYSLRDQLLKDESATLVNWSNLGRPVDTSASETYWRLKIQIWPLIEDAKKCEASNYELAITKYLNAIAIAELVARIQPEGGFVGKLIDEEREELGLSGVVQAIDRLTICLRRVGREQEARAHALRYFQTFRRDREFGAAVRILKRVRLTSFDDA